MALGSHIVSERKKVFVLAVQHSVADYDAWKTVFDSMPPSRFGAQFHRVNRLVDDPNMIAVVSGFESAEAAQAMINDHRLKEAMGEAGVTNEPRFEIYEQVEFIEY